MIRPLVPAKSLVINGKFLSASLTGVHRVAGELTKQMFALLGAGGEREGAAQIELWIPSDAIENARKLRVPFRVVGPMVGIPWEQVSLPWHAKGRLIVSLCNVGPMATRNAVTMIHDAQVHITPDSYSLPFRLWYRIHQPIAGKRHRRILTVSDFSREQLELKGLAPANKIGVVLNGIDHVSSWQPAPKIMDHLDLEGHDFVVALANTQPHKNIPMLIRAFSSPRLKQTALVLYGPATRADFEAMGVTIPETVRFAGRVSDDALRTLYENALCIAFPSMTEGFGLPPLEAMYFGCPAIVAPNGALPQVCGDSAIYANPASEKEWADAILRLREDSRERERLSRAGVQRASKFSWRSAASTLIDELLNH